MIFLIPIYADKVSDDENLLHELKEATNSSGLSNSADQSTFNAYKQQGSIKTLCQESLERVESFWQPNRVHRSKS